MKLLHDRQKGHSAPGRWYSTNSAGFNLRCSIRRPGAQGGQRGFIGHPGAPLDHGNSRISQLDLSNRAKVDCPHRSEESPVRRTCRFRLFAPPLSGRRVLPD
jgi:hypothetical protein